MIQKSVCELGVSHGSGSATSRTIHEEMQTKKNLAKILKSANLVNFMQDRKSLEERTHVITKIQRSDNTKKSLKDFFSIKTDSGIPWTSLELADKDPLMKTTPLKKTTPQYDSLYANEVMGELRKIGFFRNYLPMKCFYRWRTNVA